MACSELEDDFEMFCRLGKGSIGVADTSPSSRKVFSATRREFLAAPTELSRNRAGSLRESRHHHGQQPRFDHQKCSPFSHTTNTADYTVLNPRSPALSLRRHSLTPGFQNLKMHGSIPNPSDKASNIPIFERVGSFCDAPLTNGSGFLPPINIFRESNPERGTADPGLNIVRVRSFRRTKAGVVSEGDREVHVMEKLESRRRNSQQDHTSPSPTPRPSKSRGSKGAEMGLVDKCEAARSIRRKSFTGVCGCGGGSAAVVSASWSASAADGGGGGRDVGLLSLQPPCYTVQVLGADHVGKTTMCTQFLTSESLDDGFDSENTENVLETVTVDVDGEHTSLLLIDDNYDGDSDFSVIDSADAYLVVYAIDDRESFKRAQSITSEILGRCKIASAIVLVGNKSDLVRSRAVTYEEGKNLASVYSCGFFEVSIALNHRVNDLLVNMVSAIKVANQRVNEERLRLSRIASIKVAKVAAVAALAEGGLNDEDGDDGSSTGGRGGGTWGGDSHHHHHHHHSDRSSSCKPHQPKASASKLFGNQSRGRRCFCLGLALRRFFKKHFSANGT